MKRIIAFIMLAALLLGFLAPLVRAEELETTSDTEAEEETLGGWLSDDFRWELEDGTLTISGEGVMPGEAPWKQYANEIESLYFDGNIYTVQAGAFRECRMLKEIQFSSALTEIGEYAFEGCSSIEQIHLPKSFKRFGTMCFAGCDNLTKVYCTGYMPRFEESCLWNANNIDIFYEPDRVWGVEDVKTLERNFGGRLEVLCTDGTDPIPNEDDEEDQEEATKPTKATEPETVPPATEAATVPTVAVTEPPVVIVPETIVPETTVPETTVPETVVFESVPEPTVQMGEATEPVIEDETVRGGFIGLVLVVGVLTFFIVGALAFKIRSRSGRY